MRETGPHVTATWLNARLRDLKGAEILREFASEREVVTTRIRLVENVKVLAGQSHAPKAVGAARASHALDQVGARGAALTLDAMLASNQRLAISAVRTIGAVQTTHTVMAPDEPVRVIAERAVVAALAGVAGNAPRIGRTLTQLPYEIAEARLEVPRA